jgi:hypothetical protein
MYLRSPAWKREGNHKGLPLQLVDELEPLDQPQLLPDIVQLRAVALPDSNQGTVDPAAQ